MALDLDDIQRQVDDRAETLTKDLKDLFGRVESYRETMTHQIEEATKNEILEALGKINVRLTNIETRLAALEPEE